MKEYAVRNLRLCTKDCLCLYVCPTGATDTENSIIDKSKCIGCGACAKACPSGAISIVPYDMPPQQPKAESVAAVMNGLARDKVLQENEAKTLAESMTGGGARLMAAVAYSCRRTAEDIYREAGYMLPQSRNTHKLLEKLAENESTAPQAKQLLDRLPCNEE